MTEGQEVIFDTRLQFGEQGDCECIEEVTLLRLRRNQFNDDDQITFFCDETTNNCVNKSGYVVRRETGQRLYNFSLVLPSADLSSSGRYYAEVEVKQPGVTSVRRFWKIFNLTINPGKYHSTSCGHYSMFSNLDFPAYVYFVLYRGFLHIILFYKWAFQMTQALCILTLHAWWCEGLNFHEWLLIHIIRSAS